MNFHKVLCHVNIIFSGLLLILVILNHYNPTMEYLTSTTSKVFLVIFIVASALQAILTLTRIRRSQRTRARK